MKREGDVRIPIVPRTRPWDVQVVLAADVLARLAICATEALKKGVVLAATRAKSAEAEGSAECVVAEDSEAAVLICAERVDDVPLDSPCTGFRAWSDRELGGHRTEDDLLAPLALLLEETYACPVRMEPHRIALGGDLRWPTISFARAFVHFLSPRFRPARGLFAAPTLQQTP